MPSRPKTVTLPAWTVKVRNQRDRASLALVADVVDAVASLSEPGLPPLVRKRLGAIVERSARAGQGVPVSLAARLLAVSEPTVRAWIERGVLDVVEGAKPLAVTPKSLGEALIAATEVRGAGRDERLLRRVLDFLEDARTRRDLADRVEESDARVPLARNELVANERSARAEAERARAELEQFADAAAHDLQEPLRLMSGFADLLRRRHAEQLDDDGREVLDAISRSSERARHLIGDLLQLSRVGHQEMHLATANLREAVDEALGNLAPAIDESGAQITVEALPEATFDRHLMGLVFQNLISNSIKHATPTEPPRIRISGSNGDVGVAFQVADDGPGIDPAAHERIFMPFERLQDGEGPPGTGFGLAIVHKALEMHDGAVEVDSTPGAGATFTVTMPAASSSPPACAGG